MDFLPLYLLLDILRFDLDELFSVRYRKKLIETFKKHKVYPCDLRYIGFGDHKTCVFIDTRLGLVVLDREEIAELKTQYVDINQLRQYDCFRFVK